jgi:dCMP deaminase
MEKPLLDRFTEGESKRPNLDDYFMEIAHVVARRSTCLREKVGCLIVKDKRILATGYNGAPEGFKHCLEIGCLRDEKGIERGERHEICRAVHAEQNAIIQAALHGVSIENSMMYSTHQPCILCAKMMINARIRRIVYAQTYPDKAALEYLKMAGIEIKIHGL